MMELSNVTFIGPPFEEAPALVAALPDNMVGLLRQINGFILLQGGLHVRGICATPEWHSLASVLAGPGALHAQYPALLASDVPFAQDCVADQYVLREGVVYKLEAETGQLSSRGLALSEFFASAQTNPIEFLGIQLLLRYQQGGGVLLPGQVLNVYPPFCTQEAAQGVSLRAVPVGEALAFLADFSRQISSLADGESFRGKVVP
jgi:hypothetical protein